VNFHGRYNIRELSASSRRWH